MTKKEEKQFKDVYDVLSHVQKNLKAPKKRENKFGGYKYRNAEDILDGLKEVLPDGAVVTVEDDIILVPVSEEKVDAKETVKSSGRVYVKATATISYHGNTVKNVSYAREEFAKKGMDSSQLTGATSSYARKYALNGLFMIDDTQDADATNDHGKAEIKNAKSEADVKAGQALGGSIASNVADEERDTMYRQALVSLNNAATLAKVKEIWTGVYKGRKVFTDEQFNDLELAKDRVKEELERECKI